MEGTTSSKLPLSPQDRVAACYRENKLEREAHPGRVIDEGDILKDLDPNLIVLSAKDGENPRLWSTRDKWLVTALVGFYCFLAPFTSTIFAPSLPSIMNDIGETSPILGALQIAIFLLSFATAPLFLALLSEIFGRKVVLRYGNITFFAFCLGAGFSQTTAQLSVCRFLSGAGGSASLAVLGGILFDIWELNGRARASAMVGTAITLGPVLGPVCGGWIAERASWRWTCWVPAMASAALEATAFFVLKESYTPCLLGWKLAKAKRLQPHVQLYTLLTLGSAQGSNERWTSVMEAVSCPVLYLILDPALALLSVYYAFVFVVVYLVIVTFCSVFGDGYGHSTGFIGVGLLSSGVGAMLGMLITMKILDVVYKRQSKEDCKSESRLISAFPGALFVAVGLFIYGFTAFKTHFIVPLIGITIFCIGVTNLYLAIQLYIVDSFEFPASAVAGVSVLRCLFAGMFPLFGHRLFDALGVDWGVGLLAFLSLFLGVPFLPIVYHYGPRLREIGKRNRQRVC